MPAFTFTADATSNQITIAGHGLLTGDGPAAVRNVGGALPGGLAAVTDYWVIRVDANTIKLATSSSNAMAGTAVDLTTAGSGSNILEVGIPYRRPRTYGSLVQLKSADLNNNFDAWAALHALLTGQDQGVWDGITMAPGVSFAVSGGGRYKHDDEYLIVSAAAFQSTATAAQYAAGTTPRCAGSSWSFSSGVNIPIVAPIALPAGKRVVDVEWFFNKGGNFNNLGLRMLRRSSGADVVISAVFDTSSSSADVSLPQLGVNYTMTASEPVWLEVNATNAAHVFYHAVLKFDRQ